MVNQELAKKYSHSLMIPLDALQGDQHLLIIRNKNTNRVYEIIVGWKLYDDSTGSEIGCTIFWSNWLGVSFVVSEPYEQFNDIFLDDKKIHVVETTSVFNDSNILVSVLTT